MIPLSRPIITEEMKRQVLEVLDSGRFANGPNVEQFEELFASYCNAKWATAVTNGTSAMYIALRALDIGIGDEVACPSFSFIATASPLLLLGAKPVFIDIGDDYTMDIEDLKRKIGKKTKAVITVHLYGQMGDMEKLMELKRQHHFYLVEDACHAHGAEYHGNKSGSFGDIACFSFYPSKNMTVAGEGGMVLTNDKDLDARLKALRDQGVFTREGGGRDTSQLLGFNFRMSEIPAAIGIAQLKHLDDWIEMRRELARQYHEGLPQDVVKPLEQPGRKHVYNLYVIRTPRRDDLSRRLLEDGIETGIHYRTPIHRQPVFLEEVHLPKTEDFCSQILSLPMYPGLKREQQQYICHRIENFLGKKTNK